MTMLLQGAGVQAVTSGGGPQFDSAEIGAVNAFTLAVTFDQDISASDYSDGVTVKVNGVATSITSATRQSNHAIVRYIVPVLWHGSGDTVTWEYDSATGSIVSESDSTPLGDVTAQSVTNNCEYAALLDLQADTLVLSDNDPVSLWSDQSGLGHDFTQTGSARPTKQTVSGYPVVDIDPNNSQWLDGGDFADNLPSFVIICVMHGYEQNGGENIIIKETDEALSGWEMYTGSIYRYIDGGTTRDRITGSSPLPQNMGFITSMGWTSINPPSGYMFFNGVDTNPDVTHVGALTDYSTTGTVKIGYYHDYHLSIYALEIYAAALSAANRAALETRLGARYGITVP